MAESYSLLDEFHLEEHHEFTCGGLLRSFSMTVEEVEKRRKRVIHILEAYPNIILSPDENGYPVDFSEEKIHNIDRIKRLLEELSCLQDADFFLDCDISQHWTWFQDMLVTLGEYIAFAEKQKVINGWYEHIFIDGIMKDTLEKFRHCEELWYIKLTLQQSDLIDAIEERRKFFVDIMNRRTVL